MKWRWPLAIAGIAVLAIGGGFWFQKVSAADATQARIGGLCGDVAEAISRAQIDMAACLELLTRLDRLEQEFDLDDARLLRARAQLMVALEMSAAKIWQVVEVLVSGQDVAVEDLLLGAQIRKRRHAETGERDHAVSAAGLAELHFELTNDPASLQLAWQMASRADQQDRATGFAEILAKDFADTDAGRLVKSLAAFYAGYGTKRELDPAALQELVVLERELPEVPEELSIALAAQGVSGNQEQQLAALGRLETVVKTYSTSVLARELLAIGHWRQQTLADCTTSRFHFDWLLRNHPRHQAVSAWQRMRTEVQVLLERLEKGR